MGTSKRPVSWSFLNVSVPAPEKLGDLALPRPSPEEMDAMSRTDPGALPWNAYADFLKQFTPTKEQLEALPLSADVPPFRLD